MQKLGQDFTTIRNGLKKGDTSCAELTAAYLERIQHSELDAFISVFEQSAMQQAEQVDQKLRDGKAGKLAGLVLGVKDLIAFKDGLTTCGSKLLSNFKSPYNAFVIDRLSREDVIFIGKTNMDEFAMGSSNETSFFGPVKNPHDSERVPGGSSGGSAAAVGGGLCTAALGSDTGGSIRQPAAFCGVVGLKPTYGRVSRFGLVAFASSLDQIGPITHSVSDAALLMNAIAGYDQRDSTCAELPAPDYTTFLDQDVKGLRVGLPGEYFAEQLDRQVEEPIRRAVERLSAQGVEFVDISLPHTEYGVAAYYIIAPAEASANLARYDGARYGKRAETIQNLEEMYVKSRTEGFGEEVKRRIMLGTYALSSGYYEAYYLKAQKARTLIKQDFETAFKSVDCILGPVAPTTAFKLNEKIDDPLTMYLTDVYTVPVNLAGLPALSLPCGKDDNGLPVGMQLIGKPFDEETLIRIADFWEKMQ
ncbi:MAG: Asp-tRNA(Asn)/Glu-tRNA(Gln) amidotransferase subunit GatA [candidate division KSB1 bacterium]|nr:Asp-tRNA(Asn)/Glu-tRNA(Gln) amidotransferase subunit GatA [candidate division KSB1 bacterium]